MGVDINTQDHRKKTPLLIVSERWVLRRIHNDYITAKLLIDAGADPSLTDIEQNNALFTAARCGHNGLLHIILQKQPGAIMNCIIQKNSSHICIIIRVVEISLN